MTARGLKDTADLFLKEQADNVVTEGGKLPVRARYHDSNQ